MRAMNKPRANSHTRGLLTSSFTVFGIACMLLAVSTIAGCRGRTLLPAPGPMNQQQARAVVHDPFPLNDIGPNDLGSRPPSYQQPLPGPVRNRMVPDAMPWLGR